jgi:hypothetical protein
MSSPLPPLQNDPSIVQGNTIKNQYMSACATVRSDITASDIAKGQRIEQIWQASNTALTAAYKDLIARYDARRDELLARIPLGPPPVPDGTSMADEALMQSLFRSAVADARGAVPNDQVVGGSNITPMVPKGGTLASMLNDAEKFGDDLQRRAVLSVAWEQGNNQIVRSWCDMQGFGDLLDELDDVQQVLTGQGFANQWIMPALGRIPEPQESVELPARIAATEAATFAANRTAQAGSFRR